MQPDPRSASEPTQWIKLRLFLCRLFLRLGARTHDVEDLAQESLARVMGRGRPHDAPVSLGYAAAVGRNLWHDQLRTRMRRPPASPVPADDEMQGDVQPPIDIATQNEDERRLTAAIEALDPRHRDAIKLIVIQRMSYADAARALGVPRGTVKSRIHYGLERLRSRLADPRADSERRGC